MDLDPSITSTLVEVAPVVAVLALVTVVRIGDLGGRLSFSAAIIDDRADGMVIRSIHARGESRTYAEGAVEGVSEVTLTPQEQQALAAARTGKVSA